MSHETYIRRCYELAIQAGKKGFDTFGALLVHDGKIIEEAENTADYQRGLFGHAEFNLVHKCASAAGGHLLHQLRPLRALPGRHRLPWGAKGRVRRVLQGIFEAHAL